MRILLVLVFCVALGCCEDARQSYYEEEKGQAYTGEKGQAYTGETDGQAYTGEYHQEVKYQTTDGDNYGPGSDGYNAYTKQVYLGKYPGKCEKSGFYYLSEYSFMMCSNENSYEQRCAPGSKNSGYDGYQSGIDYYLHDFCDVNMVDYGLPTHQTGYDVVPGYNEHENVVADGYEVKFPDPAYTKDAPKGYESQGYKKDQEYKSDSGYDINSQKDYQKTEKTYETKGYSEQTYEAPSYEREAAYQGIYNGKCGRDGFYFNDDRSFVMCSNGIGYVQRCAPGSRNSGRYHHGNSYATQDFCDVNLVDYGYGAGYHGNPYYRPNPKFVH